MTIREDDEPRANEPFVVTVGDQLLRGSADGRPPESAQGDGSGVLGSFGFVLEFWRLPGFDGI